jgi:hypothetical protein
VAAETQRGQDPTFLFFSGSNLWRDGSFLHGGFLWSPGGLDHDGLIFKATTSGGVYRYRSGALGDAQVYGRESGFVVAPGWRVKRDSLEVKVFAGMDIRNYRLWPDDPSSGLRGHYTGVHGALNIWYEPTPDTVLTFDASASSIGKSVSTRAAFGWRFFDRLYLGPETEAFGCTDYWQYRLGLHATAFKTQKAEWSAGVGWANDSDRRRGAYLRASVLTRR